MALEVALRFSSPTSLCSAAPAPAANCLKSSSTRGFGSKKVCTETPCDRRPQQQQGHGQRHCAVAVGAESRAVNLAAAVVAEPPKIPKVEKRNGSSRLPTQVAPLAQDVTTIRCLELDRDRFDMQAMENQLANYGLSDRLLQVGDSFVLNCLEEGNRIAVGVLTEDMASTSIQLRGLGLSCKSSVGIATLGSRRIFAKCNTRMQFASFGLTSDQLWRGVAFGKRRRGFRTLKVAEDRFDTSNVVLDEEEQKLSPEEEQDLKDISEILGIVELLRKKRDMTFNEVRLTIMIEDPRDVERREQLGIEDDRGCSREELAAALLEVYEGRIPQDRLILRELTKEMLNWPNLEDEIAAGRLPPVASPYAKATDTGVDPRIAAERAKVDWDTAADITPGEGKKDLGESLPPVVGYSFLYLVSSIPIIIGVAVVLILFLNSLQ